MPARVYLHVHPEAQTSHNMFVALAAPLVVHPLGWNKYGHDLTIVDTDAGSDIDVMLTPEHVMNAKFPRFAHQRLSVCNMLTKHIFINETRWLRRIPDQSQLTLPQYRAYVLQHEVGHALGKGHRKCRGRGRRTPVMMQQTLGCDECTPYPFPSEEDSTK
jgi:hypothetical protein